jgi:hypothetical protein
MQVAARTKAKARAGGERRVYEDGAMRAIDMEFAIKFPLPLRERKENHGFGRSEAETKPLIF